MSSRNLLNTIPTTIATSPARITLTGSAAKKGRANVGIASVRNCSYWALDVSMAMAYAPMPKNPMCPTDNRPVYPTTRLRLTARIAQIPKTVPSVTAKPTPCKRINATAHAMMIRLAHTSRLPRLNPRSCPG